MEISKGALKELLTRAFLSGWKTGDVNYESFRETFEGRYGNDDDLASNCCGDIGNDKHDNQLIQKELISISGTMAEISRLLFEIKGILQPEERFDGENLSAAIEKIKKGAEFTEDLFETRMSIANVDNFVNMVASSIVAYVREHHKFGEAYSSISPKEQCDFIEKIKFLIRLRFSRI